MLNNLCRCKVRLSRSAKRLTRVGYLNQVVGISRYRENDSPCSQVIARYPESNINDFVNKKHRPAVILDLLEVTLFCEESKKE